MNRSPPPVEPSAPESRSGDATPERATPDKGAAAEPQLSSLGWTSGDRWVAAFAGAIILGLLLAHWGRVRDHGAPAVEIERLDAADNRFSLDVNEATWVEWMQLEGVGEVLSRRIVEDREQNGPFSRIDDIQRVHGIGPATLERLRPWLRCAECSEEPDGPDDTSR